MYADLKALPKRLRGELVAGQLYALPRPRFRHNNAQAALTSELRPPFHYGRGGPGGWWIMQEEEVHLAGEVLVPDLGGWRRERLPSMPPMEDSVRIAPDWVCEVLSDSTHAYDRGLKMEAYARYRVPFAWIVDPKEQTLEAYQNDAGTWRPLGTWRGDGRVAVEPFESLELELARLWS